MKIGMVGAVLALCLLLTGCSSWMDGHYASVEPYMEQNQKPDGEFTAVSSRGEILDELITRWQEMGYRFGTLSELFE